MMTAQASSSPEMTPCPSLFSNLAASSFSLSRLHERIHEIRDEVLGVSILTLDEIDSQETRGDLGVPRSLPIFRREIAR